MTFIPPLLLLILEKLCLAFHLHFWTVFSSTSIIAFKLLFIWNILSLVWFRKCFNVAKLFTGDDSGQPYISTVGPEWISVDLIVDTSTPQTLPSSLYLSQALIEVKQKTVHCLGIVFIALVCFLLLFSTHLWVWLFGVFQTFWS